MKANDKRRIRRYNVEKTYRRSFLWQKITKTNKSSGGGVKPSKKIWKKWWFWLIVIIAIGLILPDNSDDTKEPEKQTEITTTQEPETKATQEPETPATEEQTTEPQTPEETELIENTEKTTELIGKNIDDTEAHFSVSKVRNDVTGNWRISTIAESIDIQEYVVSYYYKYFTSDTEIHAIVNFTYNTTTKISVMGNSLDVCIYDYVDGEEHDAKLLFGGTLLKEYLVDIDNGNIEEIQ